MAQELKEVVTRARETLLADAVGAVSVFVILCVGVSLPGLI